MIGEVYTSFYWIYGILGVIVVISLIKLHQKDSLIITTNEFQQFQLHYLFGFISLIFAEVICISTFYPILVQLELSMDEITDLYIVSICSIAFFNVLLEIIDLGSRRGKCVLSTILFFIASLTLFSNNFEILLLGRIFYGGGSVLLHSAFDAFMIHEHSTKGFPDDWLLNTFGKLSHSMSIVALFSGPIGQIVSALFGLYGCLFLSCLIFFCATIFILVAWSKDVSASRFMASGFAQTVGQTVRALRSNPQMLHLLLLSAFAETSILIVSFYWAPWITLAYSSYSSQPDTQQESPLMLSDPALQDSESLSPSANLELSADPATTISTASSLPFLFLYSSLMMCTMIGNYIYSFSSPHYSNETIFQVILGISSLAFFLSSITSSPSAILMTCLAVHICIGLYWPSIGSLKDRYLLVEIRSVSIALTRSPPSLLSLSDINRPPPTRVATLLLAVAVLYIFHDNHVIVLISCSVFNAAAMYFQFTITQNESKLQMNNSLGEMNA